MTGSSANTRLGRHNHAAARKSPKPEYTIRQRFEIYQMYLQMKIFERDWHGVADAAMDLREIEAQVAKLK